MVLSVPQKRCSHSREATLKINASHLTPHDEIDDEGNSQGRLQDAAVSLSLGDSKVSSKELKQFAVLQEIVLGPDLHGRQLISNCCTKTDHLSHLNTDFGE